jgi:probable rRNA maturation factor
MTARPAKRRARLRVDVTNGSRNATISSAALARWIRQYAPRHARGTVTVALVTDARMRVLNRTFRAVDRPTDVLSFPADRASSPHAPSRQRGAWPSAESIKPFAINHLGDIAIAIGVARRQARAEGHALATEVKILALHGLLHLLGYDHERDSGAMRRVEDRLRRRAGLPSGLIARGPRRTSHR